MIPNLITKLLGNGTDPDPGRGGSGAAEGAAPGGASGSHPENFEQRPPGGGAIGPEAQEALKNDAEKFAYGELEIAVVTGISQKNLAKKRAKKLREGVHWSLNGLRVAYSAEGVFAIMEAVTGQPRADGEVAKVKIAELQDKTRLRLATPKKEEPAGSPNVQTGKVRRFFANPYLMECELPELPGLEGIAPTLVTVRVRKTVNFRKGMAVPLRWDAASGRYELARREPRFPGRW